MELISHGMSHDDLRAISSDHELIHCLPLCDEPIDDNVLSECPSLLVGRPS